MATVIYFDKEHKVEVNESPAEVRKAILGCGAVFVPIISLTSTLSGETWINGAAIRQIIMRGEPTVS